MLWSVNAVASLELSIDVQFLTCWVNNAPVGPPLTIDRDERIGEMGDRAGAGVVGVALQEDGADVQARCFVCSRPKRLTKKEANIILETYPSCARQWRQ